MATISNGYLYWIHLPEHTDINTQGYVGITNNIQERFRIHRNSYTDNCKCISRAIKKYGNSLVYDVIFTGPYEGCLQLENYFRPALNTGWNIAIGDGKTTLGLKCHSNCIKALKKANSKSANIYKYKTNILIAENVIVAEWARNNGCIKSCLCRTANQAEGRKQHKGYYIKYNNNKENK